jgi:hypothetical protein
MENISKHITYEEATKSITAIRNKIDNTPGEWQLQKMRAVANYCFEPIRKWYGKPIRVNSFFRSPKLNDLVGSTPNSQHVKGEAIDLDAGSKEENKKIFDWAKANLIFDQLINEYDYSWVHISFKQGANRNLTVIIK